MNRRERRARRAAIKKEHRRRTEWADLPVPQGFRDQYPGCAEIRRFYANGTHSVQLYQIETEWGPVEHLIVRRHDERPERSWSTMQRIKNEICGRELTAIEVYPPDGAVVDQANLYHLWVLPQGFKLPFGLDRRGGGMRVEPQGAGKEGEDDG